MAQFYPIQLIVHIAQLRHTQIRHASKIIINQKIKMFPDIIWIARLTGPLVKDGLLSPLLA